LIKGNGELEQEKAFTAILIHNIRIQIYFIVKYDVIRSCAAYKESQRANRHIWFLPTSKANDETTKEPVLLPTLN